MNEAETLTFTRVATGEYTACEGRFHVKRRAYSRTGTAWTLHDTTGAASLRQGNGSYADRTSVDTLRDARDLVEGVVAHV